MAEQELRLQRCRECRLTYFPPQPFCPGCNSGAVDIVVSSGRGFLYSYVVSHLPVPGFEPPYVIAVVELDEGPRLLTNLVDAPVDPQRLVLDSAVEVVFADVEGGVLPFFRVQA